MIKFLNFFQRIYRAPSLTLENISIFHQSLRGMFWMIIVNIISVLPRAGYQNVFPGLGEPISGNKSANRPFTVKLKLLVFYSIFIDFELRESKISWCCQFWPADRPMWPNSNKSPDFSLFENIQNLAQLLLVPELSSFTFGLSGVELGIIQKKTELSFKIVPQFFVNGFTLKWSSNFFSIFLH